MRSAIADAKAARATALASPKSADFNPADYQSLFGGTAATPNESIAVAACNLADTCDSFEPDKASFDMETQWGESRAHKVREIEFERREVIHNFEIYYASRESLIAMGVDFGTEKRVSFPESFKESKYAKPPKGWKP
jgi:hypothetical protein